MVLWCPLTLLTTHNSQHYRDPWTDLDSQQATEAVKTRVLCCTHKHRIYPSAPPSPSPSPCHLRTEPDLLYHSDLAHRPCPRHSNQSRAVRRQRSGLGCSHLGCGCLYLAIVVAPSDLQADTPALTTNYLSICLSICFSLSFTLSNLTWPGPPSDRQLYLSTYCFLRSAPTILLSHHAHEDLYVLTTLPGRDLSQPLHGGCFP